MKNVLTLTVGDRRIHLRSGNGRFEVKAFDWIEAGAKSVMRLSESREFYRLESAVEAFAEIADAGAGSFDVFMRLARIAEGKEV